LFRYCQCIIDLDAEVPHGAFDFGMPEQELKRGDPDFYALQAWTPGTVPQFSDTFRFRRAIRVIPIDQASMEEATSAFDSIVEHRRMCISRSRIWEHHEYVAAKLPRRSDLRRMRLPIFLPV
jgi:hypothetical protein